MIPVPTVIVWMKEDRAFFVQFEGHFLADELEHDLTPVALWSDRGFCPTWGLTWEESL